MRIPKLSRRWVIVLGCILFVAGVASAAWASELYADAATAKRMTGVWEVIPGEAKPPAVWWFRADGTFSFWVGDAEGKMRPAEHGWWRVSGQLLTVEYVLPPDGGSGPGCRLDQTVIVHTDGKEMVLAGWLGETLRLRRR